MRARQDKVERFSLRSFGQDGMMDALNVLAISRSLVQACTRHSTLNQALVAVQAVLAQAEGAELVRRQRRRQCFANGVGTRTQRG